MARPWRIRGGMRHVSSALLPLLLIAAVPCTAAERLNGGARLTIHGPDEVRTRYCRELDGVTWLELPGGGRFELVTDPLDPAIANPGDGAFHPFDEIEVRAAIAALRYPLGGMAADLYLLPYPRRSGLESAAGPGMVLLSPGMRPLAPERQQAEVVHELGHVVHYRHLPDADVPGWSRYRVLRGIEDPAVYRADAPHADRPHEIFAEDFRALFGGALANYSGSIENPDIAAPAGVAGLEDFMVGLAGVPGLLSARPNPARGPLAVFADGGDGGPLDLFDVGGRRIATLAPQRAGTGWTWRWDGRDARGREVAPGVVLARRRDVASPPLRIVRLP